jgi:TonB family protein
MRVLYFCALYLAVVLPGFAQTAANAETPMTTDPHEIFAAAASLYDFTSPELKPWHLKASYQFYDLKGNPTERGIWEYWWASPKVHRSSLMRGAMTTSEWRTRDGITHKLTSGENPRYFERSIASVVLSPLPMFPIMWKEENRPTLSEAAASDPRFSCFEIQYPQTRNGKFESTFRGGRYCFDKETTELREIDFDANVTKYDRIEKMQGRYLDRTADVWVSGIRAFSISVDSVDQIDASDANLHPPSNAQVEDDQPPSFISSVAPGKLVKKEAPKYPKLAKIARQEGTVILSAIIGKNGQIRDLEALSSPSNFFAEAATKAVSHWEYQPYQLNGKPVEVETTINVIFKLKN